MICSVQEIFLAPSNQGEWAGREMWHEYWRKIHTGSLLGNLKEEDHLKDRGRDGKIVLRWILRDRMGEMGLDASVSG